MKLGAYKFKKQKGKVLKKFLTDVNEMEKIENNVCTFIQKN